MAWKQNHPEVDVYSMDDNDTQSDTQGDTQGDTQSDTQGVILDDWIVEKIIKNPKITTEELATKAGVGIITIKRHIAKMPHVQYVGSGYSGHWEVVNKEETK